MKVRDSGMPEVSYWEQLFDVNLIVTELEINDQITSLVEVGSGYGTFTLPAAKLISGKLVAFDIEDEMIDFLSHRLEQEGITNVILEERDILTQTTGLVKNSADYFMLFNILHHDNPNEFFSEAYRVLKKGGKVGIIHWRSDIETPRGPDLSIRPTPEEIIQSIDTQKFSIYKAPFILAPYHFGIILSKL